MNKDKNLYLVGFMCSGKTTAGRLLARRLGRPFADSDAAVERAAGCTVSGIIRKHGLAAFRKLEAAAVKRLCARRGAVIALGGGVYPSRRWRGLLERTGTAIFLDVPWPELEARLKACRAGRPLLAGGEAAALRRARRLLLRRRPYYRLAARVNAAGLLPEEAAAAALKKIKILP